MSEKILNTVRGSGKNIIERAGKLTLEEIRKEREIERKLKGNPELLYQYRKKRNSAYTRVKRKNRTMLWP